MQTVDTLIIHAGQLITGGAQAKRGRQMRELGLIEDGAVAIRAGRIAATGRTPHLRAQYQAETIIDAGGRAVIPGLVDCHTHAVYAGSRLDEFQQRIGGKSYMAILADGGGILSTVNATRTASLDDLIASAESRLKAMLALGTTTVEIKTGYGLDTESEVKMLRAIAAIAERVPQTVTPTFLGAHAIPPEYTDAPTYADYVLDEMLPAIVDAYRESVFPARNIPLVADVFCEEGVFDVATSRRILQTCRDGYAMTLKAHVDEFVNLGGATMAVELGAISVDHLDVTPPGELERIAKSNAVGVMLPAVNFNLGNSHYGNARHLIDSGGLLALSTDYNPGSAPTLSLPFIMALACRYQKLTPAEALNACTINAAEALGMAAEIGSLTVGKRADIVILSVSDYRTLAYEFGAGLTERVLIGGETVWPTS